MVLGPCAAESQQQLCEAAHAVQTAVEQCASVRGAARVIFRAGAWKPRTMPGHFEGVGEDALRWLKTVQDSLGLEAATEVASAEQVRLALAYGIRCLWLGARTTTNPFLVKEIADVCGEAADGRVTVLVKNPVSPDLNLWKGALLRVAERVGLENVIAVHRGFTGNSGQLRNMPGWSLALELHRQMPDIPLLLDPSHLAGDARFVGKVAGKSIELGYDGMMVEVHPRPDEALSDKKQQLSPDEFVTLLHELYDGVGGQQHAIFSEQNELAAYRAQIDELDDELWQTVLRRMSLSRQIGEYKRAHNIPVLQSDRWQQLVRDRLLWAERNELSEENVMRILDALHDESRRMQTGKN